MIRAGLSLLFTVILLCSCEPPKTEADIKIESLSLWKGELAGEEGDHIVLGRTWYVPREDALAGRTDTSLEACLAGEETLIPLGELAPPYIGLLVDGRPVDAEDYPLVKYDLLRIQAAESSAALPADQSRIGEPPALVWIAAAGDLMLGRGAEEILLREGSPGIFGSAAKYLAEADCTVVNLEGPVSNCGSKEVKTYNFRFSPKSPAALKAAGIDAVLLANNHAFDWGSEAFLDTLTHLEEADVGILGAGRDWDEAARPWVTQKGKIRIYAFGIASFPSERSGWNGLKMAAGPDRPGILHTGAGGAELLQTRLAQIPAVEEGADTLSVVFFHGGAEWSTSPDRETRERYTALVHAGADLVIGSHPHIVQGFEWVEGKPVFWSLGNFVFAGMENTGGGDQGLLVVLGFWGKRLVYLRPYPLVLTGPRTDLAEPGFQRSIMYGNTID